jgi:hypothetical protein
MASLLYRVPILSRFVRKGGTSAGRKIPGVEVQGSHPCKERKDGAPSTEMVRTEPRDGRLALRRIVRFFWVTCLFCASLAVAQDKADPQVKQEDLKLLTIGHGKTLSGHAMGFRIYGAPDGTKGQTYYAEFDSVPAARQQIEEWANKSGRTVTSRERNLKKDGQLIDERVMAIAELPQSNGKEFVIVRRDGLSCYLIESASLQTALKIEGLIQHK